MTTTPSSRFHPQLLPLLPVILLLVIVAAEGGGCRHKCGDIDIPYPFGIGAGPGCFRRGFEVLCDDSHDPPRAFLPGDATNKRVDVNFTGDDPGKYEYSPSPLELVSVSVGTGEARAYSTVAYRCITTTNTASTRGQEMDFSGSPFAVSAGRNVLIGVGRVARPRIAWGPWVPGLFCRMADTPTQFGSAATNGSCAGRACCEVPLPGGAGTGKRLILSVEDQDPTGGPVSDACNYAMLAEKSWYTFSTPDMYGNNILKRLARGVPFALDFVAGNALCPAEGRPTPPEYACVSANSLCANATYTNTEPEVSGNSYICKCWDHYDGNPYVPNGCQDIDECKVLENPCSNGGVCKNKLGGHDCPCKSGMKDDGKGGPCTLIFPLAARATVGAVGGILLMAIILFLIILHKEKKKTKEFYKKNGGPILEQANTIKLFKKGELKPILTNSNLIGKGCFGEVYKGLLDNKQVAIKKPINGSVQENDQFANEVIIQSQVIHKNIVRLIGCCLEVDAPMLVYEFISQGSLHDILHDNNNKVALSLDARLSIAAQSADGLAYMHSQANTRILHGDVKPANILLDDNFAPKISDFGISRLLARDKEHTGLVIGDMNYMDPVYLQEGLLTEKSDVYSFGVVILELISSRRAIHSENNGLVKSFLEAHKKQKKATEFFDKEIAIAEDLELLDSLADMAVECFSLDVDQRPTMMEVAERLHKLSRSRKVQDVRH